MCFNKTVHTNFIYIYLSGPKSRLGVHLLNYIQETKLVDNDIVYEPMKVIYKNYQQSN